MWRKNFLWNYIYKELITYPVYANLSYWWNFGVLSFVCLVIQVITGIFLAMYYNATSETAFLSVEHIMRDINYGWLIRYVHANGASFFFLCVYLHMFRNLYYNSYLKPRELLWCIGMVILVLMILTAFLGYVILIYAPSYLGHSDNYIMSNPLVTPAHIVPEWYFLPFHAISRSIPDKLNAVTMVISS